MIVVLSTIAVARIGLLLHAFGDVGLARRQLKLVEVIVAARVFVHLLLGGKGRWANVLLFVFHRFVGYGRA